MRARIYRNLGHYPIEANSSSVYGQRVWDMHAELTLADLPCSKLCVGEMVLQELGNRRAAWRKCQTIMSIPCKTESSVNASKASRNSSWRQRQGTEKLSERLKIVIQSFEREIYGTYWHDQIALCFILH